MIVKCAKCKTKYNNESVNYCPKCEYKPGQLAKSNKEMAINSQQKNRNISNVASTKRNETAIIPARGIYYKNLVTQKLEENATLLEHRNVLADTVKSLWKQVRFLEKRRKDLETYVASLEKDLLDGGDVLDSLDSVWDSMVDKDKSNDKD